MLNNNQRYLELTDAIVEFYNLLDAHHDGDIELSQQDLDFIELGIDSMCFERLQLRSKIVDFPRPSANFFQF